MRCTSRQLRVSALCVNLGLALGVPAYAAYRYWSLAEPAASEGDTAAILDRRLFVYSERHRPTPEQDEGREMERIGDQLDPRVPAPQLQGGPEPPSSPDPSGNSGELTPGKLHEAGWYYYAYVLREGLPLKNRAILHRRDPREAATDGARIREAVSGSSRRGVRPDVRGKAGLPTQRGDVISFAVEERQYVDTEKGIDFMIHSADEHQLLYWHRDDPTRKMYALKYEPRSHYSPQAFEAIPTLGPMGEQASEVHRTPAKKPGFVERDIDFAARRELSYQQRLATRAVESTILDPPEGLHPVRETPRQRSSDSPSR